jgi:hypothetical protein
MVAKCRKHLTVRTKMMEWMQSPSAGPRMIFLPLPVRVNDCCEKQERGFRLLVFGTTLQQIGQLNGEGKVYLSVIVVDEDSSASWRTYSMRPFAIFLVSKIVQRAAEDWCQSSARIKSVTFKLSDKRAIGDFHFQMASTWNFTLWTIWKAQLYRPERNFGFYGNDVMCLRWSEVIIIVWTSRVLWTRSRVHCCGFYCMLKIVYAWLSVLFWIIKKQLLHYNGLRSLSVKNSVIYDLMMPWIRSEPFCDVLAISPDLHLLKLISSAIDLADIELPFYKYHCSVRYFEMISIQHLAWDHSID